MQRESHKWYSHRLDMEMPLVVYGHSGIPLLMFPTASADCEEYERFHLISAMGKLLEAGMVKIFSIDSINRWAWGNHNVHPGHKSWLGQKYDEYITEEVVPFIYNHCNGPQPIVASGASMGAFYASNTFFKHPDIFDGLVGLHGVYDLAMYYDDYFDDYCYFNNPSDFLKNLDDDYHYPHLRAKKHVYLITSTGKWENPEHTKKFSRLLSSRALPNHLHVWDNQWPHDWTSWRHMLPKYMDHIASDLLSR